VVIVIKYMNYVKDFSFKRGKFVITVLANLPVTFILWFLFTITYKLYISLPSVEEIVYWYHFLNGDIAEVNIYSIEADYNSEGVHSNIYLSTQGTGGGSTGQSTGGGYTGQGTDVFNTNDGDVRYCEKTGGNHDWSRQNIWGLDPNAGTCYHCKGQITHSYYQCQPCLRRLCGGCDTNFNNHAYQTFIRKVMHVPRPR
jgi:hypothetical protein